MKITAREVVRFLFWWGALLFICWTATFGAGWITWRMAREIHRGEESRHWPKVSGQILSSSCDRSIGVRAVRLPDLRVRYRYDVDGLSYEGTKATFAVFLGSAACGDLAAEFVKGAETAVFYRPGEPQVSVLRPGTAPPVVLLALVAVLCLLLTVASVVVTGLGGETLVHGLKEGRRPRRSRPRQRRR